MRSYYIFKSGRIKRKENTIFFEYQENGKRNTVPIPVEDVEQLFFFGEVDMNSKFLNFAAQNDIMLHFFNYYGFYIGTFFPRKKGVSGYVIIKQVEHYLDRAKRLLLARKFVESATHNIRRMLSKRGYDDIVEKIKSYESDLYKVSSIVEVMSVEAHARRAYYSVWNDITGWEFGTRDIRPPSNELNALISFGNSLLYSYVLREIYKTPLNPAISYLHEPSEKRFSLSLDLAEVFKPVFVDRLIFRLVNNGVLKKEEHFISGSNGTFLNEEGRKIFVKNFDDMMDSTILHRSLRRKIRYKNLIKLEAYKILKHVLGEKEYKPLKVWW